MKQFWKKSSCSLLSALIFSTVLMGCGEVGADGSSTASLTSSVGSQTADSESDANSESSSDLTLYLNYDDTKSEIYNETITAYNEFLNEKIQAKDMQTEEMIGVNDAWNSVAGEPGIGGFALYDVNNDNIPELHTISNNYDVFSYQNRRLWHWYTSNSSTMHGPTYILENGALFSEILSTGYSYYYTTFDSDGTVSEVEMHDPGEDYEGAQYYFNGKEVSKEEYERLSKKYMDLAKKRAVVEWHAYEK